MSKNQKTNKPANAERAKRLKRFLLWINIRCKRVGYALISRRLVVNVLLSVIAVELVVLGVGLSRRLELANEHAMVLSQAQLAVLEAQALSEHDQNKGAAGIGASAEAHAPTEDAPPPLRPRDINTILAQEANEDLTALTITHETTPAADAANNKGDDPAAKLNPDDREELDRLIRKGVTALTAGDVRLCIISLEQARALSPEHPAIMYYFGLAYDKLQNPLKAREFYTHVFQQRDKAGVYFQRAARRLTFGFEQPGAMRGKLSFGPHQANHTYSEEAGEKVEILLPVLLAPGESIRPEDIYITLQFFDLVNGRKVAFSRLSTPKLTWQNAKPDWTEWEEHLIVNYDVPPLTSEEKDAYGDLKYYGFTAKLYYKGEPLDCLSSPSALILHEQRINHRRAAAAASRSDEGLLPSDDGLLPTDDGLIPAEEALPVSEFPDELLPTLPES